MARMTQVPFDILNVILVFVATSRDGARDLARVGATCKELYTQTRESNVLRAVNFQRLTFTTMDYVMHRHTKDLLCLCARVGNQATQSILGKAILVRDPWFWGMILEDNQQANYGCIAPIEALHHHSLVRTFILHATSKDIVAMREELLNYVITYTGYNSDPEHDIISAIYEMCSFEATRLIVARFRSKYVNFSSFESVLVLLDLPIGSFYRDIVVMLFDKLFPSARD